MMLLAGLCTAVLCSLASAGKVHLRQAAVTDGFVRDDAQKYRLRVCNAYPSDSPMEVSMGRDQKLTGGEPLAYKQCRDFSPELRAGDKLQFTVGEAATGAFAVQQLPSGGAVMLLVAHRHDASSSAMAFESHVFANIASAQVAVIDAYQGKAKSVPRIADAAGKGEAPGASRSEQLGFDRVVAVTPGLYEVDLAGSDGASKAPHQLVALNHESYVVIRTGMEGHNGVEFPQDLLVFPQSDPKLLHSGAVAAAPGAALLAAALAAAPMLWGW